MPRSLSPPLSFTQHQGSCSRCRPALQSPSAIRPVQCSTAVSWSLAQGKPVPGWALIMSRSEGGRVWHLMVSLQPARISVGSLCEDSLFNIIERKTKINVMTMYKIIQDRRLVSYSCFRIHLSYKSIHDWQLLSFKLTDDENSFRYYLKLKLSEAWLVWDREPQCRPLTCVPLASPWLDTVSVSEYPPTLKW